VTTIFRFRLRTCQNVTTAFVRAVTCQHWPITPRPPRRFSGAVYLSTTDDRFGRLALTFEAILGIPRCVRAIVFLPRCGSGKSASALHTSEPVSGTKETGGMTDGGPAPISLQYVARLRQIMCPKG
jgi:hypothetical protein